MKLRKILIIGSAGRIGRILAKAFSGNFEIFKVDIRSKQGERSFRVDLSDLKALDFVFQKISPLDCIFHLAAEPRITATWQSVLKNNIIGTRNIYECARKYKVKRVIFASSNHATGAYEGFPPSLHKQKNPKKVTTKDPLRPDGYYGTSKIFGEAIARQFFELYGIESICLRIGSVLENDDPTKDERLMRIWLSHRDLAQLFLKSIFAKVKFGIYYATSDNKGNFLDISSTKKELGYKPQDDASRLRKK